MRPGMGWNLVWEFGIKAEIVRLNAKNDFFGSTNFYRKILINRNLS
jgi:hypothetical protein